MGRNRSTRGSTFDANAPFKWISFECKSTADPKIVRAFVKRLRKKLGDDANRPTYIATKRGVG